MLVRQRHWLLLGRRQLVYWGEPWPPFQLKHLLAITVALLPSAVMAQQFTPQQMLDVMTKSPSNRDVRVHDADGICTPKDNRRFNNSITCDCKEWPELC